LAGGIDRTSQRPHQWHAGPARDSISGTRVGKVRTCLVGIQAWVKPLKP
jgi:hypothetical protein